MNFSYLSPITEETTDDELSASPTTPTTTTSLKNLHASWSYKEINNINIIDCDDLYSVCQERSIYKQQQQQQGQIKLDFYTMRDNHLESGSGDENCHLNTSSNSNGNNSLSKSYGINKEDKISQENVTEFPDMKGATRVRKIMKDIIKNIKQESENVTYRVLETFQHL
ncbi:5846_t:CDS:2, partial [Ambispora leptoticha]